MGDLTAHFSRAEFACPCGRCGGFPVEPTQQLVMVLEAVRHHAGRPVVVNSGVRCPPHNFEVGGVEASEHTTGEGADVKALDSRARWELVTAAIKAGVRRIGIGKTFVHVGISPVLPTEVIWIY